MKGKELQKGVVDLGRTLGCVKGEGFANSDGYMREAREGVRRCQHVWAWIDATGVIPAKGEIVHHECGNKWCVNPAHLRLMTRGEHARLHFSREVCKNGHSRVGNTTKSGNCKTCLREYLRWNWPRR